MLTQFFKSINWVDVALAALLFRVVFVSVQSGFITEVFKFLGVITALFVSLHWYAYLAATIASKTTLSMPVWEGIIFITLNVLVMLAFKFLRMGVMLLFKVETTHQGFDKYGSGFLGAGRALLICSLVIFALLLMRNPYAQRQTMASWGYKIAAKAAPQTYKFLYDNVIGKLMEGQHFNADVFTVIGSHGINPK